MNFKMRKEVEELKQNFKQVTGSIGSSGNSNRPDENLNFQRCALCNHPSEWIFHPFKQNHKCLIYISMN